MMISSIEDLSLENDKSEEEADNESSASDQ
jgi:hypothetical protein